MAEKGLTVIGVHTAETDEEKKIEKIRKKVKENGMKYPVAVDSRALTWRVWQNQYWPSVYLIDKKGDVRYRWDGELNGNGTKGEKIMRDRIEALLAEKE